MIGRLIFMLSLILFFACCSPQNYVGQYTRVIDNYHYEQLVLKPDSTFKYTSSIFVNTSQPYMPVMSMPPDSVGKGRYQIHKKKLILDFEGEEKNSNINISHKQRVNGKYIISIHVRDYFDIESDELLGLPGALVFYDKNNSTIPDGLSTDMDGFVKFEFAHEDFPIQFNCEFIGYAKEQFLIENPNSYHVEVLMEAMPKKMMGKRIYPISIEKDTIEVKGMKRVVHERE